MLSIYRAGEFDLFENLDIVHIRLLVARFYSTPLQTPVQVYLAHQRPTPPRTLHEFCTDDKLVRIHFDPE